MDTKQGSNKVFDTVVILLASYIVNAPYPKPYHRYFS